MTKPGAKGVGSPIKQLSVSDLLAHRLCEEKTRPGCDLPIVERLILRITKQDRDAFKLLFRQCARRVVGIGYTVLRDEKEAEELVQDVFQVIWWRAHLFDPSVTTAKDWITRLTYLCAFTRRRNLTHLKRKEICDGKISLRVESVLSQSEDKLRRALSGLSNVGELFRELSEKQQRILQLNYYDGRSYQEISETLGIPIKDVIAEHISAIEVLRRRREDRG